MDYNVERVSQSQVKLDVTITAEEYQEYLKQSFEKNKDLFQVQGFRPGKAPYALVKRKYGVEVLYEDADNFALNETYVKIIGEKELEPVDYPNVDIEESGEEVGLKYTITVDVMPEFDIPDYEGMEVVKHDHPWSEADVDAELESMREQNSRMVSREEDEGAEMGDLVTLDYSGSIEGVPFEGGQAEDHELEIGSGSFIDNFEEQLKGLKVDEEKDVVVTFPEDYGADELSGKEAVFKVKINDIKYKELPELDDEFASEVSEFETLDEMRSDLHERMKNSYDQHMEDAAKQGALMALVEKTEIEVPNALVESQIDFLLNDLDQRLSQSGLNLETYYQITGSNEAKQREELRDNALSRAKSDLIVEKLIAEKDLEISEEELKEYAEELTQRYNQNEEFAEMLMELQKADLERDVRLNKVLAELVEKVTFVDGPEDGHHHHGHDHDHDHDHDHHD